MKELEENKSSISRDLDTMASLLQKYRICKDLQPLYNAVNECYNVSNNDFWSYKITGLRFDIDNIGHVLPRNADLLEVDFSIDIKGIYCVLNTICNPIINMKFDIELTGYNEHMNDLHSSWHLDKHEYEDVVEPQFIHPEYHFTFGGRKMWGSDKDYGAALIMSSPRIFHPPMDGILGIDFILQNYISKDNRNNLTSDRTYKKLLFNSQLRIWRPYWLSVASAWNNFEFSSITFPNSRLVPNLSCEF